MDNADSMIELLTFLTAEKRTIQEYHRELMKETKWEAKLKDWRGSADQRYWTRRITMRDYFKQIC
jgi:hypothetical protein